MILELGANDGLRGLPLSGSRHNLAQMVRLSQAAGARVLLVGMRLPPNYGPRYTEEFARIFPDLANQYHLPLVPFLLDRVALDPELMQEDGLHPNAKGEPRSARQRLALPAAAAEQIRTGGSDGENLAEVVSAGGARRNRSGAAALAEGAASSRPARLTPTGLPIVQMGAELTYRQLDERSRAFGAWLQQAGFKKGDRIAIMLPNTLQYPIALFGALRAGLTVVNTNPLYTAPELEHQLKDSGATAIVVLENFAHVVQQVIARTKVKRVLVTGCR